MIDIGSHVVCIDDDFPEKSFLDYSRHTFPVKGKVYTVRAVLPDGDYIGFRLVEIVNPPMVTPSGVMEQAFYSQRFKPLKKLRVEDFVSVQVEELA